MRPVYVVGAMRTMVAPRGGAFADIEAWELGAAAIRAARESAGAAAEAVDGVIMGNALYGGGDPARMAALGAGLPDAVPALTVDTQCCSGLDAVALAADRIAAGGADLIVAGGLESYSRAPIRMRRPRPGEDGAPVAYDRPPFAPDPASDPDPADAIAALAEAEGYSDELQRCVARESHAKARDATAFLLEEIAPVPGAAPARGRYADPFTRDLTEAICRRAKEAATTAVEADAAAALVLSSRPPKERPAVCVSGAAQAGADPRSPAEGAVRAAERLLARLGLGVRDFAVVELMEAFAAQAIYCADALGVPADRINLGGGALARGHPIGASGAILAVRLFHELRRLGPGAACLATIAAVGGLGSALALESKDAP